MFALGVPLEAGHSPNRVHALAIEVEAFLQAHAQLSPPAGCVLAVSGGHDSMLLLEIFTRLRPKLGSRLVVAHFNHHLRGDEADADQRFVQQAATTRELPWEFGSARVRERRRTGESLESAARRLRHAFLASIAKKHRCRFIATAHHADDQLELFLLRMLRGAGGLGLGGMSSVEPSPANSEILLLRPFLHCSRDRLATAARELGIAWREDASNQDRSIPRNRVRHELIPLLQNHYQPGLARVIRRTQVLLEDQALAIETLARQWLDSRQTTPFAELPVALQRDVIRWQGIQIGLPVSFDLVESLRLHPETPHQISPKLMVARDTEGRLKARAPQVQPSFQTAEAIVDVSAPRGRAGFGGLGFSWRIEEASPARIPAKRSQSQSRGGIERLDADVVGPLLHLRHWRPGDRFQPIGFSKPAKLQDIFTNAKVPAAERRCRVLAASADGAMLWVQGLRLGEPAKLTPATKRVLVLEWRTRS